MVMKVTNREAEAKQTAQCSDCRGVIDLSTDNYDWEKTVDKYGVTYYRHTYLCGHGKPMVLQTD